jgi:hypothetical protein
MAYTFEIHSAALKRNFAVYVVVARGKRGAHLYVGKTGDNREGCNPLVSRCGNHFSYNKIHSQIRNKIDAHENWSYTYVFDHFDGYCQDVTRRRARIDRINDLERWLNLEIQVLCRELDGPKIINAFKNRSRITDDERRKRASFHTAEAEKKIRGIVAGVKHVLKAALEV